MKTIVSSLFICAIGCGVLVSAPAFAQDAYPPAEFIATVDPVYYEGHAAYYYGNHWYWRDEHGGWQHYDREPPALADRRLHHPPAHHDFGHGGGGGHAGGHGGGRR